VQQLKLYHYNPYKTVNYAVGITAEDMATGDFLL